MEREKKARKPLSWIWTGQRLGSKVWAVIIREAVVISNSPFVPGREKTMNMTVKPCSRGLLDFPTGLS